MEQDNHDAEKRAFCCAVVRFLSNERALFPRKYDLTGYALLSQENAATVGLWSVTILPLR